jgi:hypothetical protein
LQIIWHSKNTSRLCIKSKNNGKLIRDISVIDNNAKTAEELLKPTQQMLSMGFWLVKSKQKEAKAVWLFYQMEK